LQHPATGETMVWEAQLPQDFKDLLTVLDDDVRAI
jgi:hypothetical protein